MKNRSKTIKPSEKRISRRQFVGGVAATTATFTVVPRYVLGRTGYTSPSEKLNVAVIGTGGQGIQNIKALLQHPEVQIVAVCDVTEEADYSRFYYGGTGGRKPALKLVEKHYSSQKSTSQFKFRLRRAND